MTRDERFIFERFPKANKYHPDWILAGVSGGANALWLTDWLSESLDLRPGMRRFRSRLRTRTLLYFSLR